MHASLESSVGSAPGTGIVLVEEYDALAAAIESALKKFAPGRVARIARSLAEAETFATKSSPSLFVFDFDPPPAGAVAFFSKMKTVCPGAGVLVLVPTDMRQIAERVGRVGAFRFLAKPFELEDLGAAVEASLNAPLSAASNSVPGTLRDLCLTDLVLLKCSSSASEALTVTVPPERTGSIHFREGQIYHASLPPFSGVDALVAMLQWPNSCFAEAELTSDTPRTIFGSWKAVLLDVLPKLKGNYPSTNLTETQRSKPLEEKAKAKKKIVVIDDTEMLLIFVEDVLSWNEGEFEVLTASTGIDGQQQVEKHSPDVILLDYSLPDIKGDEVCRRLLANKHTARIPIIMMSGHVLEMKDAAVRYENIVATIAKPFLSRDLIELVQKTLVAGNLRPRPSSISLPSPAPVLPASVATAVPIPNRERSGNGTGPEAQVGPEKIPSFPPRVSESSATDNEVVLALPLEVMSLQLTPLFKIGSLQARPSVTAVSLRVRSSSLQRLVPLEVGFELGPTQLNSRGRIDTLRLIPGPRAALSAMSSFAIETAGIIPVRARHQVQITPSVRAPMMMQLLAHFRLLAVELAPNLEIGTLVVKAHEGSVRVTLDAHAGAPEGSAATFDYIFVKLDDSARIAELALTPLD